MFKSQKEILEFTFRLRQVADRLSVLERQVSMDFMSVQYGVAPEDKNRIVVLLGLTNQELARTEHELELCRTLNEQALMSLECEPPSAPQEPLDDGLGPK